MSAPGTGDSRKVVVAALLGNAAIATAKFTAAAISGSVAMLAEAVHSLADTANQGLLLLGLRLAKQRDPTRYPLGRARESYFWAFIVALMLFFVGGVYAIYEGLHKLTVAVDPPGSPIIPIAVLVVSFCFEAGSFTVAAREFNQQRGSRPVVRALFSGKDPTIPLVVLEDTAAMVGLVIALAAVGLSWWTKSVVPDAIGSMVIGVLLCTVGVALGRDTRSLLIGEGVTPEVRAELLELANGTEGVERVTQLLTLHLGPQTVLVALKVRFRSGMLVDESERVIDRLEERIRSRLPQMKRIFVEPDGDFADSYPLAGTE